MTEEFINYLFVNYSDKVAVHTIVKAWRGWTEAETSLDIVFIKGIGAYESAWNYVMHQRVDNASRPY